MDGCKGHISPPVSERLIHRFDYQSIHLSAEGMAEFSMAVAKESGTDEAYLPLCHTVMSQRYGAKINLGNWKNGPRVTKAVPSGAFERLNAGESSLESIDVTDRRLLVWEAIRIVCTEGVAATLVMEGPLTVLTNSLGFENTIRQFKQQPKEVAKWMDTVINDLECYMERAISSGAQAISFADPVASIQILGPRFLKVFAEPCHDKMAVVLKRAALKGIKIKVCPMLKREMTAYQDEHFLSCCR